MWSIYIIECADSTLYTGISNNVEKRILTHNKGKGAKYTKTRLPVKLVFQKEMGTRSDASKKEYQIKQLSRKNKLEIIKTNKL